MSTPLAQDAFEFEPNNLWVLHCAIGPVPKVAIQAMRDYLPLAAKPWSFRLDDETDANLEATREAASRVLGAAPGNVALTLSTSGGLVTVAQGFPWQPGDEILIPAGEFPSNYWPWKVLEARGVSLREVPLWEGHRAGAEAWGSTPPPVDAAPEERLIAALGPRTKLLAVSWVRFQDGLKLDLRLLGARCAERGVALVVDGIQGAGTEYPDLTHVAAFATGAQKGLLSPLGSGFLWTAPEFRHRLTPLGGWLAVEDATNFNRASTDFHRGFVANGMGLELGTLNYSECLGMKAALELISTAGCERIRGHILELQGQLLQALSTLPAWRSEAGRLSALHSGGQLGSILAFHHAGRGLDGMANLVRAGIARGIWTTFREGYLRIAFHGWHEARDIEPLVRWLAEAAR